MERHPYFDLWLHSDAELAGLLQSPVEERATLHEWPLSCVQRLGLADGRRLIYKAQLNEGVEAAFYARVRSPLLPSCRDLGVYANTSVLLLEYIDAPLLEDLHPCGVGLIDHAARLEQAVAQLGPDAPVYADLGSAPNWLGFAALALEKLDAFTGSGLFQKVSAGQVKGLRAWSRHEQVLDCIQSGSALAHADLTGSNVFVLAQGYKIIDWQYPRHLPRGFDRAALYLAAGVDPLQFVQRPLVELVWFVRLAWFVECQARLFPEGNYDRSVSELAGLILG